MLVTLTVIRYPKQYIFFALLAMAIHHIPLWFNKRIGFYKLMGTGKNGSFDKHPEWQQWSIMATHKADINIDELTTATTISSLYGKFIAGWLSFFHCEAWTIFLQPVEGHGRWDGKQVFGELPKQTAYNGPVCVLTRATIRFSKLKAFWQNADAIASFSMQAPGLLYSLGIGELPFIKQATFSTWQNKDAMKAFAYKMQEHATIIKRTRQDGWYSEEMFVRFIPLKTIGTTGQKDPLAGKLYI